MSSHLTADLTLNDRSYDIRPGLADCLGQRGPARLTLTMRVDLDVVDLAAALLTYLDHEYGELSELRADQDAWQTVATYVANNGLGETWMAYRDAVSAKAPSVCPWRCGRLPGDQHAPDCLVGWCLARADQLLAGTVPVPPVSAGGPRQRARSRRERREVAR